MTFHFSLRSQGRASIDGQMLKLKRLISRRVLATTRADTSNDGRQIQQAFSSRRLGTNNDHARDNVVRVGLKPVLSKLGIPDKDCGLHAFRHGLTTALAEASVPITVMQGQLRHSDVGTTWRVYAHSIPESQRDAMEKVGTRPIITSTETLRKLARN